MFKVQSVHEFNHISSDAFLFYVQNRGGVGGKRLLSLQFRVQCTSSDVVETTGDS